MITTTDLRHQLMASGVPNGAIFLGDAHYQPPKADYLLGEYDGWFASMLDTLGLGYSTDMWDCEDYADLYSAHARIAHKKTPGALEGHALPVGVMHFLQAPGQGHAIVVAYTSDKGLIFIEPQLRGHVVDVTAEQLRSAWLVKI